MKKLPWLLFLILLPASTRLILTISKQGELVDAEVIVKVESGQIVETHSYKKGMAVGRFFGYNLEGRIVSKGFGVDGKKYKTKVPGTDLSYSL